MAGTITLASREKVNYGLSESKRCEIVTVSFVGDAANGTVPVLSIPLYGYLLKVVTNPGSTAPTDNWDIALQDPADSALDAAAGKLVDRDTTTTEQVYPVVSGAVTPIFLAGTYGLAVTGNSVNSATGDIILYLVDGL